MNRIIVGLVACLALFTTGSQAAVVYSSTGEQVTIRNCVSPTGTTGCDTLGPATSIFGGLPGDLSSSASISLAGSGSASGSAALSGLAGAPVLRGSATSEPGKRTSSNSIGLQRYTYTGSTSTTRIFSGTLSYSQTMTGDYSQVGGGGVTATLNVFKLAGGFEVGATSTSNFNNLFDPSSQAGYFDLGSVLFNDPDDNSSGLASFGVGVALDPGDSFFAWALLQTPAPNGSVVDASNTLITQWNDSTDLVPAAVVPEPATIALVGLGLAGLGFGRRRGTS